MPSCSNVIMSEFIEGVYVVHCLSPLSEHFVRPSVTNKPIFMEKLAACSVTTSVPFQLMVWKVLLRESPALSQHKLCFVLQDVNRFFMWIFYIFFKLCHFAQIEQTSIDVVFYTSIKWARRAMPSCSNVISYFTVLTWCRLVFCLRFQY